MDYDAYYEEQLWEDEQAYIEAEFEQYLLEHERAMEAMALAFDQETYCPDYDIPWETYTDPRDVEIPF